jgi:ribosomal protein S10
MSRRVCSSSMVTVLPLLLILSGVAAAQVKPSSASFEEVRGRLLALEDIKDSRQTLAFLFRTGDERIEDLIKALDDPDKRVSLRAQIVIRYLGNENGMKALVESYRKRKQIEISGPVPLPLNNWDYTYIQANYAQTPPLWDMLSERYIYALALDDSQRAKQTLSEIMKNAGNLNEGATIDRAIKLLGANQPEKLLTGDNDLGKLVLQNAFFVAPIDRKYTSARLLGLNGTKDKALVEIYINRGPLAEEWYHIVIKKSGQSWKFFSITQIAVS